jgi:hypothetical protein
MRLAFGTPLLLLLHDESEASRAFPRRGMKSFWYLTTKHVAILGASQRKLRASLIVFSKPSAKQRWIERLEDVFCSCRV